MALGALLTQAIDASGAATPIQFSGDLDGSYVSQTVVGVQGHPVPAPTVGALQWDGGAYYWAPAGVSPGLAGQALWTNDAGAATVWAYPHGDVDASATDPGALTVTGLQGRAVSSSAPTTGNTIGWNGSVWMPGALNLAGGSGYVTGSLPLANTAACAAGTFVVGGSSNACSTLDTFDATHGRITAGGTGSDTGATIGPLVSGETVYAALYLLPTGTTRTVANAAIYGDGANALVLNTPGANPTYYLRAANSTFAMWDATTPTTPVLSTAPTVTSFTLATGKSGATLSLAGDLGVNVINLTTFATITSHLEIDQEVAPGSASAGTVRIYVDSADGRLKSIDSSGNIMVLSL